MMHIAIARQSEKYSDCFDTFIWGKWVSATRALTNIHGEDYNIKLVVDTLESISRQSGGGMKLTVVDTVDEVRQIFGELRDY
jgi:hypothetical protein